MSKYSDIKNNLRIGVGTTLGGLVYAALIPTQVSSFSEGSSLIISGRTLPALTSAVLIFLGLLLTLNAWRELKSCSADLAEHKKGMSKETGRVIVYTAAIAVYLAIIKVLGFELASFFMVIFAMIYSGCKSRAAIVLGSVLTPAVIYFVFVKGMYMVMPDSLLGNFLLEVL